MSLHELVNVGKDYMRVPSPLFALLPRIPQPGKAQDTPKRTPAEPGAHELYIEVLRAWLVEARSLSGLACMPVMYLVVTPFHIACANSAIGLL